MEILSTILRQMANNGVRRGIICGVIIQFMLATSAGVVPGPGAATSSEADRWVSTDLPADGEYGGWVLASGSDVQHLAITTDGTIYAAIERPALYAV